MMFWRNKTNIKQEQLKKTFHGFYTESIKSVLADLFKEIIPTFCTVIFIKKFNEKTLHLIILSFLYSVPAGFSP